MISRVAQTIENHKKGYNCAQAVVCAYCDLFDVDQETAFRFAEGFGGGMGGMRDGTCGAVTGMYMLAGLKNSSGSVEKQITKSVTYKEVQHLAQAFKDKNRSYYCFELMGKGSDPSMRHACNDCIADAALIIEALLLNTDHESE